jgi:stage III sporulation protein AH
VVKRQTVWLSTMMVLSLMVIGYVTLGTPPQTHAPGTTPVTRTTVVGGAGGGGTTPPASHTGAVKANATASDWFTQMSLDESKKQSHLVQTLEQTLANPRASNSIVAQAFAELSGIQTQQIQASKVHDELVAQGYPDSIVIFNPKGRVHVYVEASFLTPKAAVLAINLVSQALGVQSNLITISPHE